MKKPLTKTQHATLDYLKMYNKHGFMPSIAEMSEFFGVSISTAWERIKMLQDKGWVERKKNQSRWIVIL